MLEKVSKKTYFILLLLVLLVVCVNSLSLFQTSLPVGIDGYYYVLQIDAFRESGQFYFSTSTPLVLFFLNALNTFFGNPVLSIKIGSLFLFVMLLSGIFASVLVTTRDGWSANSAVAIAALSNLHFFYLAEFINNLGSLAFILFGIVALLVFEEKRTKTWLFVSVSAFAAAVFSHRSAIIIFSAILFWLAIVFLFQKLGSRGWGPLVALCAVLFVSPLIFNYISIVDLPETLSSELVSTPVSPFMGYGVPEKWILLIALCLFIAHLENFSSIVKRNRSFLLLPVVLFPASFISLNPFLNHSGGVQSVTGRFDTLLFIAVAVVIP